MADSRTLQVVLSLKDQISTNLRGVALNVQSLQPEFQKVALMGGAAFGSLALAVGSSIKEIVQAESAQNRLTHLMKTASGATSEQVQMLFDQASALEKIGVVADDNINVVQSQLATFNLSADAIQRLTPAVLDYVVAEKGASATAEDFRDRTNGLAQALNGNFASLTKTGFVLDDTTKYIIQNGNEAQKTAAIVKVLSSTYQGMNTSARATTEGALKVMSNEFANMQKAIGSALVPEFNKLAKAITPAISAVGEFIGKHPELIRGIVAFAGVASGLVTVLGLAAVSIGAVSAAVGTLGITIGIALPWIGLVSAAVGAFVWITGGMNKATNAAAEEQSKLTEELSRNAGAMSNAITPTKQLSEAQKQFAKDVDESAKKVAELNKKLTSEIVSAAQDEASSKRNIAEEIVAQEQKIADIKKQIAEGIKNAQSVNDFARLQELQSNLAIEQQALDGASAIKTQLANEVAEAERRASITAFQRRLEDIQIERASTAAKHSARILEINAEITAEVKKNDEIKASFKKAQESMRAEITTTTSVIQAEATKQKNAMMAISSFKTGGVTTSAMLAPAVSFRASGGPVSSGSPYIVGEQGPELFVPRGSGTIIPNGGMGGTVVNVTVNGDVSGSELVSKVQNAIMDSLRMNTRLAV